MPHASSVFPLQGRQPELDFVDIDVVGDVKVFVDPLALRHLDGDWPKECVGLLQSFFDAVLAAIRRGDIDRAAHLFARLNEPNEVHFGFSKGMARGHGVGIKFGYELAEALAKSEAVESGLLKDLEDTILMVENVSVDLVSDMTVNIIREPLIHYTQSVCNRLGIPLVPDTYVGPTWDPATQDWQARFFDVPFARGKPILFVPKSVVRRRLQYDDDEYFRYYVLPFLEQAEIAAQTNLVRTVKGIPRVTKKDLVTKYGHGKKVVVNLTRKHPEILKRYREVKGALAQELLEHEDFAGLVGGGLPDWDGLLAAVVQTPRGREHADDYHRAVARLLNTLFYPALTMPEIEYPIHHGRKIIDIAYVNEANDGFFLWLSRNYRAPYVLVECKNYTGDPGNPELDQLGGRFSPNRGNVGILACRGFKNKERFLESCRDTAMEQRGFVIPLDDRDLADLVAAAKQFDKRKEFALLKARFERLIN